MFCFFFEIFLQFQYFEKKTFISKLFTSLYIFLILFFFKLLGYICKCPPPLSGDPYKAGCVIEERRVPECTSNNNCASNLYCHNGTCISPCTNLLCGTNAFCEPENHAGWCRCKVGFVEGSNGECVSREYTLLMSLTRQYQLTKLKHLVGPGQIPLKK
jgi:hypothetical protein